MPCVHLVYVILVSAIVITGWLSLGTSDWIEQQNATIPVSIGGNGVSTGRIQCGIMSYCVHDVENWFSTESAKIAVTGTDVAIGSVFCSRRYGNHFNDIPFVFWRYATGFALIGLVLWTVVLIGDILAFCCCRFRMLRSMRNVGTLGTLCFAVALGLGTYGFKDSTLGTGLCEMCSDAKEFNAGSCAVGISLILASTMFLLSIGVAALGYYVPHVYTGKNKVTPIHAALHDMPKY